MYRLYYAPGAASFAVHWMLIEIGVPFEVEYVDFQAKAQKSRDYLKLNPLGMVPVLVVDEEPRTETGALLMLLAERHGEAGLAPSIGSPDRAEYLQLMFYLAYALMPAFRAWFYPQDFGAAEREDEIKANARGRIEKAFDYLDARLSDGRDYFAGGDFSTVDILATMLARWSRNMPKPADDWPNLKPHLQRMKQRPALHEAHEREGLSEWIGAAEVS